MAPMLTGEPQKVDCPHCSDTACVPDPKVPWGFSRADSAGCVRLGAQITCCHCGEQFFVPLELPKRNWMSQECLISLYEERDRKKKEWVGAELDLAAAKARVQRQRELEPPDQSVGWECREADLYMELKRLEKQAQRLRDDYDRFCQSVGYAVLMLQGGEP